MYWFLNFFRLSPPPDSLLGRCRIPVEAFAQAGSGRSKVSLRLTQQDLLAPLQSAGPGAGPGAGSRDHDVIAIVPTTAGVRAAGAAAGAEDGYAATNNFTIAVTTAASLTLGLCRLNFVAFSLLVSFPCPSRVHCAHDSCIYVLVYSPLLPPFFSSSFFFTFCFLPFFFFLLLLLFSHLPLERRNRRTRMLLQVIHTSRVEGKTLDACDLFSLLPVRVECLIRLSSSPASFIRIRTSFTCWFAALLNDGAEMDLGMRVEIAWSFHSNTRKRTGPSTVRLVGPSTLRLACVFAMLASLNGRSIRFPFHRTYRFIMRLTRLSLDNWVCSD